MDIDLGNIASILGDENATNLSGVATGYSTDSRTTEKGDLFIPLIAERDGHDFIEDALSSGAIGHLYSHGRAQKNGIKVTSTIEALHILASEAFRQLDPVGIGITGSVGKTTTKDMIRGCLNLSFKVWASERSFNNEIGVPLTILSSPLETEYLILEMGARGIGHIQKLCQIANPKVGVVTCIGNAHSEFFGGLANTINAKGELVESLQEDALAVLNFDDLNVRALGSRTSAEILLYGVEGGDVVAENITVNPDLKASFDMRSPWGSSKIQLNVPGKHNITNALAAVAVAMHAGAPISSVVSGLESVEISPLRMETFTTPSGILIINDAYNANPLSMKAALSSLVATGRRNLVAVLGVMAELGDDHVSSHEEIGQIAKSNDVDVISLNVKEYGGQLVSTIDEAYQMIKDKIQDPQNTALLLKGSRVVALENLAQKLTE